MRGLCALRVPAPRELAEANERQGISGCGACCWTHEVGVRVLDMRTRHGRSPDSAVRLAHLEQPRPVSTVLSVAACRQLSGAHEVKDGFAARLRPGRGAAGCGRCVWIERCSACSQR